VDDLIIGMNLASCPKGSFHLVGLNLKKLIYFSTREILLLIKLSNGYDKKEDFRNLYFIKENC